MNKAEERVDRSFLDQWADYSQRANRQLEQCLNTLADDIDHRLASAMQHSTLNGGKRFRAMLVYAGGECFGADINALDGPALALEMVLRGLNMRTMSQARPSFHCPNGAFATNWPKNKGLESGNVFLENLAHRLRGAADDTCRTSGLPDVTGYPCLPERLAGRLGRRSAGRADKAFMK